jgi:hypothetical protein
MLRFVASILLALSAGTALPANIDPRLAKFDVCGRFEIFHINGIQTTETEANDNRAGLSNAYGNSHNEHLIAYRLAYNPTQGALLDLVDVFAQKLNEYPGATFAMIVRAFLGRVRNPLPETLADELQRILIERIRGTGYVSLNDADLARVVDRIRSQRMDGAKTLLVPHSQGNLYANSAYAVLTQAAANPVPAKSLAIVGVASPAAFVAGTNGRYVTSRQDLVIFGLRKLLGNGSVLPGNVTQPLTLDDPLGHNFQAIYLRPNTNARTKLLSDIAQVFDALRTSPDNTNRPIGGTGVTLTWNPPIPAAHFLGGVQYCAVPARIYWSPCGACGEDSRMWRQWVDAQRSELEPLGRSIAESRYEAGLRIWREFVLTVLSADRFAPRPQAMHVWEAYSADEQSISYYYRELQPYWVELFECSDGTYRSGGEVVGAVQMGANFNGYCSR